jgi:sulfatase maturation enzyme AslB (radical SAM superfamily)
MCAPSLSTMMYKEYAKWKKQGIGSQYTDGALAIAADSGEEFLSKSEFFRDQVTSNLQHVLYMEFRGGEVFADKESIDFIEAISHTEYAAGITLDISTNATLLTDRVITILNRFKGGKLRLSIDAYKEDDEWIRYHTDWDAVMSSMDTMDNLHEGWIFLTQTTVQLLNCLTLDKLIVFFNDYIIAKQDKRFFLGFTSVRGKDWLRHEMVPLKLREEAVAKLNELRNTLPIFQKDWETHGRMLYGLDQLVAVLSDAEYTTDQKQDLSHRAQSFFETLTRVRKKDYFERFPHIKESVA